MTLFSFSYRSFTASQEGEFVAYSHEESEVAVCLASLFCIYSYAIETTSKKTLL